VAVLLRRPVPPQAGGLPDAEARLATPELVLRGVVGPQAERVDVEPARRSGSCDGMATKSTELIIAAA
jgi:hypothetical protein